MPIRFFSLLLLAWIMISFIGCATTWNGISQTEKPGTYYVVTNTARFMGVRPGALLCTSDPETGDLKCKRVQAEEVWDE